MRKIFSIIAASSLIVSSSVLVASCSFIDSTKKGIENKANNYANSAGAFLRPFFAFDSSEENDKPDLSYLSKILNGYNAVDMIDGLEANNSQTTQNVLKDKFSSKDGIGFEQINDDFLRNTLGDNNFNGSGNKPDDGIFSSISSFGSIIISLLESSNGFSPSIATTIYSMLNGLEGLGIDLSNLPKTIFNLNLEKIFTSENLENIKGDVLGISTIIGSIVEAINGSGLLNIISNFISGKSENNILEMLFKASPDFSLILDSISQLFETKSFLNILGIKDQIFFTNKTTIEDLSLTFQASVANILNMLTGNSEQSILVSEISQGNVVTDSNTGEDDFNLIVNLTKNTINKIENLSFENLNWLEFINYLVSALNSLMLYIANIPIEDPNISNYNIDNLWSSKSSWEEINNHRKEYIKIKNRSFYNGFNVLTNSFKNNSKQEIEFARLINWLFNSGNKYDVNLDNNEKVLNKFLENASRDKNKFNGGVFNGIIRGVLSSDVLLNAIKSIIPPEIINIAGIIIDPLLKNLFGSLSSNLLDAIVSNKDISFFNNIFFDGFKINVIFDIPLPGLLKTNNKQLEDKIKKGFKNLTSQLYSGSFINDISKIESLSIIKPFIDSFLPGKDFNIKNILSTPFSEILNGDLINLNHSIFDILSQLSKTNRPIADFTKFSNGIYELITGLFHNGYEIKLDGIDDPSTMPEIFKNKVPAIVEGKSVNILEAIVNSIAFKNVTVIGKDATGPLFDQSQKYSEAAIRMLGYNPDKKNFIENTLFSGLNKIFDSEMFFGKSNSLSAGLLNLFETYTNSVKQKAEKIYPKYLLKDTTKLISVNSNQQQEKGTYDIKVLYSYQNPNGNIKKYEIILRSVFDTENNKFENRLRIISIIKR